MSTDQLTKTPTEGAFSSEGFDHAQRVAKMLAASELIPKQYQGNIQNTMIALEMANRIGASPLAVMQNLHVVQGKPGWTSTFIIALVNSHPKYEDLQFDKKGSGMDMECTAWTYRKGTKERIEGPKVTMAMAKAEGWIDRNGSKWKTMPDLMIMYRAATFFGRLYTPELMIGMQTTEEIVDVNHTEVNPEEVKKLKEAERVALLIEDAATVEELDALVPFVSTGQTALFQDKLAKLSK